MMPIYSRYKNVEACYHPIRSFENKMSESVLVNCVITVPVTDVSIPGWSPALRENKNLTGFAIFYYIIHQPDIVTIWQPVFISGTFISSDLKWMIKTHPVISDRLGVRLSGVFRFSINAWYNGKHGKASYNNKYTQAVNTFPLHFARPVSWSLQRIMSRYVATWCLPQTWVRQNKLIE